jgi:phage-related minor tail protein
LLKGLGNWGSTGGGQGTFIGGIVSGLFGGGRANGGPVEAGRSYLVGEFGPELIHIGAQGGTVTPTEKLMGKAVTVINNFTFDRPVDRRTQEQVAAMAGGAIQTAMRRNG